MRKTGLFFLLFFFPFVGKSQLGKEAWHWHFGDSCLIDFSSGIPVTGTCAISTGEGSASISDSNTGQLLFYTDGTNAWDRNNNLMPNGFGMIGGQGTSTQAALIVPKPGSSNIYYLISADQGGYAGTNTGVHYSIVDMSLNGGLGDITTKNTSLTPPPTTEKLTAVKHCNGKDYWIITHNFNSNVFNAYLLTATGINSSPVISSIGSMQSYVNGNYAETAGYLKVSSNGKKMALGIVENLPILEIYDFNNSNGQITNPITIPINYMGFGPYGIAFSPDNTKLYATVEDGYIYQYDLSTNTASTIIASQTIIDNVALSSLNGLQLAPDGKIYLALEDSTHIGVINNPNNLGVSCNFNPHGLILPKGARCISGLPNFIEANGETPYFSRSFNASLCSVNSYSLYATSGNNYQWFNGDTNQIIKINNFGNYWVSYTDSIGCIEIDTFHITVAQAPVISVLHDSVECGNIFSPAIINASYANVTSYLWSDGFTSPIHTISTPGKYEVAFTFSNNCTSKDSLNLFLIPFPIVNLGADTTFCTGVKYLNASNFLSTYLWTSGETTPVIKVTQPGIYWVKVNNKGCISYDTLIIHPNLSQLNFLIPNVVTPNNDGINDFIDFSRYQFSSLQLEIYNRWGLKIFESNDPNAVWKPTEDDGTYFYSAQYKIDCGAETQNKSLKGFITLLR